MPTYALYPKGHEGKSAKKSSDNEDEEVSKSAMSESGSKSTVSVSEADSEACYLQPRDYEKIAIVQNATEGKAVAMGECGHTAEAWEMERKMRTFQQLGMARKLRSAMEQAYEDAKKLNDANDSLQIFEKLKKKMVEMISLTDAVKGGYTLDRYNGNEKVEERRMKKEIRSHRTAQSIFGDYRKRMAWEQSPDLYIEESRADQLSLQSAIERDRMKRKKSTNSQTKSTSTSASRSSPNAKKSRSSPNAKKIKDHVLIIQSSKNSAGTMPQPAPKPHVAQAKAPPAKAVQTKATQAKVAKKPKPQKRKCHYCKLSKANCATCTYWRPNGRQCKKRFCEDCIQSNSNFQKNSFDWHCPICLGVCDCDACNKARELEQERLAAPRGAKTAFTRSS